MVDFNLTMGTDGKTFPLEALISLVPHLIWAALAFVVLHRIGINALRTAFARVSKIGVAGLEFEFRSEVEAAVEAKEQTTAPGRVGRVARRLAACVYLVRGARILWVDDCPANNLLEASPLQSAGASIIFVRSTKEAIAAIQRTQFDLLISDIARGDEHEAGLKMAEELAKSEVTVPIIYYVGKAQKPTPDRAFGITNRPDELLHLVLDVLARERG